MNIKLNFNFFNESYQKWYGGDENDFHYNLTTGLVLGVGIYFIFVLFIYRMYNLLSFNVSFFDPSSIFAENVIHLYNIVWIVLIFVIFLILVLLIRIIYLFSWNFSYFSSDLYVNLTTTTLEYLLAFSLYLEDNNMTNQILDRLALIDNNFSGLNNIGLNLWYNKNGYSFLSVSDISEYRYLEVIWCLLPIGSLLLISIPTFSLIFSLDSCVDPVYTVKVIGRQWYWTYDLDVVIDNNVLGTEERDLIQLEFTDDLEKGKYDEVIYYKVNDYNESGLHLSPAAKSVNLEFDSNLVSEDDLIKGTHRLLEVDNRLFLPVGVPVRLLITSSDVLHSWAVPSLGIKVDAVPGRLNQFVVEIKRPGVFYGQCSELCGPFHGFMPIVIQAVSLERFEEWLVSKIEE
jgi:heme/copper-type cytochrome/quinol oxidase subunit 2